MQKLVNEYLSATGTRADQALNTIINTINANQTELTAFKTAFIATGQIENHWGVILRVMERLDFIPQSSSPANLPSHVYRGAGDSPTLLLKQGGFSATGKSKNLVLHKRFTGEGLYVSTSKQLSIALEHACKHPIKWVYKISTHNGICVNDFLSPLRMHHDEEEVAFAHKLPFSQIEEVAIAHDFESLSTDFFLINQHIEIAQSLENLGLAPRGQGHRYV